MMLEMERVKQLGAIAFIHDRMGKHSPLVPCHSIGGVVLCSTCGMPLDIAGKVLVKMNAGTITNFINFTYEKQREDFYNILAVYLTKFMPSYQGAIFMRAAVGCGLYDKASFQDIVGVLDQWAIYYFLFEVKHNTPARVFRSPDWLRTELIKKCAAAEDLRAVLMLAQFVDQEARDDTRIACSMDSKFKMMYSKG